MEGRILRIEKEKKNREKYVSMEPTGIKQMTWQTRRVTIR